MIIRKKYDPEKDFTPERRKEIYSELKGFLKETEEDGNLLDSEKEDSRREILAEFQIYDAKYEAYHASIGIVKKLFVNGNIRESFSLD